MISKVNEVAGHTVFSQRGSSSGHHVNLVKLSLPVFKLSSSAVALILVLKLDIVAGLFAENLLHLNPSRLEVASVVSQTIGQSDAFTCNGCIEEQTGFCIVITGSHAKHNAFSASACNNGKRQGTAKNK